MLVMRSVNKKKKNRANKANKLRVENFMNYTDSDNWDNIVLGLDESTKKLLWFREGTDGDEHLLIDLQKMGKCKLVNVSRNFTQDKTSSTVIDQLGLELLPKDSNESPVFLEFYNATNVFVFNIHLQLQAKWHKLITSQLEGK